MLGRATMLASRFAQLNARRALHKGVDSTPPLRFTSVGEKVREEGMGECGFVEQCSLEVLKVTMLKM